MYVFKSILDSSGIERERERVEGMMLMMMKLKKHFIFISGMIKHTNNNNLCLN